MSQTAFSASPSRAQQLLFWGCFIALVTTSFSFIGRMFLIGTWETQFELDKAEAGRLAGIGIWPFAVSIILFSLVIDRIGYKTAMYVAFIGHAIWTVMAVSAYYVDDKETAYGLLYWGSLICALANGTVEAFINPVVATMFSKEKTKWLNILHAGWPAGLVITGLLLIAMGDTTPWAVKVGLIGIPAVAYFVILVGLKFPESERVTSGVSYREMLQEFGVSGAVIVAFLLVLQLMDFFSSGGSVELSGTTKGVFIGMGVLMVAAFGLYTQTFGRPFLFFMIIIMMPLATTEIGTDGWITNIMEGIAKSEGFDPGWILVYTSAIMLILRFFAGPIVHTVSPLGLLAISAMLAVAGLFYLSTAEATAIFFAATLYGFGKTFFWPTMLGVVSEQCPKGGALTLNAISGIGMLAVGTLGFPFIGTMQEKAQQKAIVSHEELPKQVPGLVVEGNVKPVTDKTIYEVLEYSTIDEKAVEALVAKLPEKAPSEKDWDQAKAKAELKLVNERSSQRALAGMAFFPAFMLVCYIALIFYFKTRGGYVAEELTGHSANDEKYTGGVAGAVE
jgi:MFS family permease